MQPGGSGESAPGNASPAEIARFDALAGRWWDPSGPMHALHKMNPARVGWIVERIAARFPAPDAVRLLDVGCGAGLAAEALARQGYDVLGIDAAREVIGAARAHAEGRAFRLLYRACEAESLLEERFEVVTALEVIEHVPDPVRFIRTLSDLLAPSGMLFLSTINRTPRALLTAKLGAEWVLRWLPVGTHDWRKFIRPAELGAMLRRAGLGITDLAGMSMDPLTGNWRVSRDVSVNYITASESD